MISKNTTIELMFVSLWHVHILSLHLSSTIVFCLWFCFDFIPCVDESRIYFFLFYTWSGMPDVVISLWSYISDILKFGSLSGWENNKKALYLHWINCDLICFTSIFRYCSWSELWANLSAMPQRQRYLPEGPDFFITTLLPVWKGLH